jgi:hypothetical protein
MANIGSFKKFGNNEFPGEIVILRPFDSLAFTSNCAPLVEPGGI